MTLPAKHHGSTAACYFTQVCAVEKASMWFLCLPVVR